MKLTPQRLVLLTLAGLAGVALAGLAFVRPEVAGGTIRLVPRFPFREWTLSLPSHLPWVIPFALLTAMLPLARALAWRLALPHPRPSWRNCLHALLLGGLVQNAIPGHLGPFASARVLARGQTLAYPTALASLLVAKLVEFGALVAGTALLVSVAYVRGPGEGAWHGLLTGGVVACVVFAAVAAGAQRYAGRLAVRITSGGRFQRVAAALRALAEGLHAMGSLRRMSRLAAVAVLPVLASATAYGLALRHQGVDAYFVAGGFMVGALALSQVTPGLPAGTGLYYFVSSGVARAAGASDQAAAAVAVLSHAATAGTFILLGLVALAGREGLATLRKYRAEVTHEQVGGARPGGLPPGRRRC